MSDWDDIMKAKRQAEIWKRDALRRIDEENKFVNERANILNQPDYTTLRMRYHRKLSANPRTREQLEYEFETAIDPKELAENYDVISFFAPFIHVVNKFSGVVDILVFQHKPRLYWQFEKDPVAIELLSEGQYAMPKGFTFSDWLED